MKCPVGVAGLISPWNLPLYLLSFKIAPAMVCGNTIVAKPSEMTSVSSQKLCEVFQEAGDSSVIEIEKISSFVIVCCKNCLLNLVFLIIFYSNSIKRKYYRKNMNYLYLSVIVTIVYFLPIKNPVCLMSLLLLDE